jgi:hypothetical protein
MIWRSLYSESALQDLWEGGRFRTQRLIAEDGRAIEIEFPGLRSREGGPDFRGARLRIGGEPRAGDVELHLVASGWEAHGHGSDGAYAAVILHVVLRREPFREPPAGGAPLLVLEPYLQPLVPPPARIEAVGDLDALGEEAFRARRVRLERLLERLSPDEVLYREILVALGYKQNLAAMAELARRRPLSSLEGSAAEIEAGLAAAAAAMPPALWRLRNVRPANHPRRRLSGMARFLAAARDEGLAAGLARRRSLSAMSAWLDPDGNGLIGPQRAAEIALNVLVPFLGPEAWREVADGPPPPLPGAVGRLEGPRVTSVRSYFGALRRLRLLAFSLAPPGGE